MTIADHVIKKCGGAIAVAGIVGITKASVYRWTYEKPRGTGGVVPAEYQQKLIDAGPDNGYELKPSDFFNQTTEA